MSIALDLGAGIGGGGFICGIGCVPIYGSPKIENDPPLPPESPSSSSTSIGKVSDDAGRELEDGEGAGMGEVQSACKGLLMGMESLEESLPFRRGISNFYAGKSKSFTSLSDAISSCASAKDLAKAQNAYTRLQSNLLATEIFLEKPHSNLLRSPIGGGISKRTAAPKRRSPLALVLAMSTSPRTTNNTGKSTTVAEDPVDFSSSSSQISSFPVRSFSLGDLPVLKDTGSSVGSSDEQ